MVIIVIIIAFYNNFICALVLLERIDDIAILETK